MGVLLLLAHELFITITAKHLLTIKYTFHNNFWVFVKFSGRCRDVFGETRHLIFYPSN